MMLILIMILAVVYGLAIVINAVWIWDSWFTYTCDGIFWTIITLFATWIFWG